MHISKDALWKGIIESLIDEFIRFFFAEYADLIDSERGFEFLDTELQKLLPENPSRRRHADKLIKVWLKDGEEVWFLIHVEVQGYSDPFFDRRMYECVYRIGDKFQRPVTALAIYTDWEHKHHFKEYRSSFLGTELVYKFNTYVLCEHSPAELSQNPNPFAAIMEAAWQYLDQPADDQALRALKLNLIERLKMRNIPRDKISLIINFIKFYLPFTNSEIEAIFEQDLMALTQADKPMGLIEAILEDVKQQGLEQGLEQGRELGIVEGIALEKREFVKKLWSLQEFSLEKVAILVDLPLKDVMAIIQEILQDEGLSQEEAKLQIDSYQARFSKE